MNEVPPGANLEAYKATLQKDVEQFKSEINKRLEQWKSDRENDRIAFRAVMEFANAAIKLLVIANGGAVLATLTFLGNLVARSSEYQSSAVLAAALTIRSFVIGMAAGLTAAAAAYVAQVCFVELSRSPMFAKRAITVRQFWGNLFRAIGLLAAAISLAEFACGAWNASNALSQLTIR